MNAISLLCNNEKFQIKDNIDKINKLKQRSV